MYVGIFGDVIFSVGHLRVLTPSNVALLAEGVDRNC